MVTVLFVISIVVVIYTAVRKRWVILAIATISCLCLMTSVFGMFMATSDYIRYEAGQNIVYADQVAYFDNAIDEYIKEHQLGLETDVVLDTLVNERNKVQSEIDRYGRLAEAVPRYKQLLWYDTFMSLFGGQG